jgi:tRNA pseudouridine38-40 synthase
VRLRLDLAYDGTGFAGWATQPAQRTVQQTVEEALARVLGSRDRASQNRVSPNQGSHSPARLVVAGRTDAGVHATGQVAHVDLPDRPPDLHRLVRSLNGVLPADVRVLDVTAAAPGFDARFSALARRYAYRVTDAVPDPLRRADTLAWPRRLDVDAMAQACPGLLGEHDFAAFCKRREGATTIRHLRHLGWERAPDGVLVARVEADAFCHSMVRALVGALLAVGEGRRPPTWPASVLAAGGRDPSVAVAPAHGLTLREVRYPPDADLAARAVQTRRRRDESEVEDAQPPSGTVAGRCVSSASMPFVEAGAGPRSFREGSTSKPVSEK